MPETDCQQCGASIPDGVSHCPTCETTPRRRGPAAFRFEPGDLIDNRYEVIERIRGGGMAELYKVTHLHLHDVRAIKILRSDQIGDENYRQRFLREARIAASIKHPNVAMLHDFATLPDKTFYMVEEFIDGQTLARNLRSGRRFSLNDIVEIARQVLLGLGAIHDKGIVHRDISPDNIMLASSRSGAIRLKVIDLGIARSIDPSESHSLTSAGLFVGKPHYASPEQMRLLEDDAPIDHRTDLYSLGVVLYEVVSGKVPFEAATPFEYLMKQLSGDLAAVDRSVSHMVPPDLERFIVTLLRAKREERFQSTIAALLALSKIRLGAATVQDVPIGEGDAAYPLSTPSKKRRQTAEVPVEQLRRLIEQDRPDSVREAVIAGPLEPRGSEEPTRIDKFPDSAKVTLVQLEPVPPLEEEPTVVRATADRPAPQPEDEQEPVAFVPAVTGEESPPQTPLIATADSPTVPVRRASGVQNPIVWFAAGIVFVAIVSLGGYLLYRWLDARFGEQPDAAIGSEQGVSVTTPPSDQTVEPESTDTSTLEPAAASTTAPNSEPTYFGPEAPPATAAAAPEPVREAAASPAPQTAPRTRPPDRAEPPEPEDPDPATETAATETADVAPVVLPADDVREGDLVAPGPGVVEPVVTRSIEPIYPPISSNMGMQGVAMFSVLVGPDGKAEVVKLIVSSGSASLDKSAEEAARQTLFSPATKYGIKVRMWKVLRFEFKKRSR